MGVMLIIECVEGDSAYHGGEQAGVEVGCLPSMLGTQVQIPGWASE